MCCLLEFQKTHGLKVEWSRLRYLGEFHHSRALRCFTHVDIGLEARSCLIFCANMSPKFPRLGCAYQIDSAAPKSAPCHPRSENTGLSIGQFPLNIHLTQPHCSTAPH